MYWTLHQKIAKVEGQFLTIAPGPAESLNVWAPTALMSRVQKPNGGWRFVKYPHMFVLEWLMININKYPLLVWNNNCSFERPTPDLLLLGNCTSGKFHGFQKNTGRSPEVPLNETHGFNMKWFSFWVIKNAWVTGIRKSTR